MESQAPAIVDARGLRCPLPVLRLQRAAAEGAACVVLLTDDPAAAADVPAFAAERGWTVAAREPEPHGATRWTIASRGPR